jgi:polyisoprenoid-binding protein YceI
VTTRPKLLIAAPFVLVALVLGGTWLYLNVVSDDAPAALSLSGDAPSTPSTPGATAAPGSADGTYAVTEGSQVGYRVDEALFGQDTTAVGRTSRVTGSLTIAGTRVTATAFTVDMASVESDKERRDGQYRGRIMDVGTYPTSTFVLASPIELGGVPADGVSVKARATGDLTLRGVTKRVTFDVTARRTGARVEASGSIHLVFDEWGIPSPSFGPAKVEDEGELEFLLVFAR